jgi:hypothetical protein
VRVILKKNQRRFHVSPLRSLATLGFATVCGLFVGSLAEPVRAANKIEGYYEAEISGQKQDKAWQFGAPGSGGMPKHYAELKFWSWPTEGYEVFAKLRAENNRDDERTNEVDYFHPPWYSGEGHIRLREKQYEAYLFYRQNRFYINDEPLLRLVDDNALKNDDWGPLAQGVRVDFWEVDFFGKLGGSFIVSDNGGTFQFEDEITDAEGTTTTVNRAIPNGDNAWISRLRHKTWSGRVESGLMFLRKDWTDRDNADRLAIQYNTVYSADLAFSPRELVTTGLMLGPLNLEQSRWTAEYAYSYRPYQYEVGNESDEKARAMAFEVRDIHVGDVTVHSWYNDFGEGFRSYLSSRFEDGSGDVNRIQSHTEAIWLVPRKAVTAKFSHDYYRWRTQPPAEDSGDLRPATSLYGELYMEYINGFKSRFAYSQWHGYDADYYAKEFKTYPNWFGEISVENFLAKIRLQARVKDAGTFRQVTVFGFDMNVNLTEKLKGYLRAMNVNEDSEARHTIFAQLKYDIGWGSEVYFEYGDAGQSDNLAYTDWFVSEGADANLTDRYKMLVKAWF